MWGKGRESREGKSRLCSPVERTDKTSRSCVAWMGERGQSRREGVEVEEDSNALPAHRHGHSLRGPRHTLSTALIPCPPPSLTLYFRCLLYSQLLPHSTGQRFTCITAKAAQLHYIPVSSLHLHGRVARARGGRGAGGGVSKFWTCCRPCSPSFRERQLGHQRNFASSASPNHILLPRQRSSLAALPATSRLAMQNSSIAKP